MSTHARLSPSNPRWVLCPGSVREEAAYPDISGDAAIDGTGSHLLLELCLDNNEPASFFLDTIIGVNDPDKPEGWMVSQDRVDRVQMCLDYIDRRTKELEAEYPDGDISVEAESKSNPGELFGRDDWYGTCDVTISVIKNGKLLFCEVIDYKDGRGYVHVPSNTQLHSYLGGKLRPYVGSGPDLVRPFRPEKVGPCRITIVQPKTTPVIRFEDVTANDVLDKLSDMSIAAARTDDPNAPLISGKHCQWCKHKPNCKAQTEESLAVVESMSLVKQDFGQLVADPASLSSEDLSKLADAEDGIVAAFKSIKAEIQKRIEADQDVPGYAMQPGRSSRVWAKGDAEVEKALKSRRLKLDDIYPKKIISPAQVMKLDKTKLTDKQKETIDRDLITTMAGKLTLKKVSRSEKHDAGEMFADVAEKPQPISFF